MLPTRRPLDISYAFYKELEGHIALIPQSIPILILHGKQDDYIPMEHIQNFRRLNEDAKLVIIPGTGLNSSRFFWQIGYKKWAAKRPPNTIIVSHFFGQVNTFCPSMKEICILYKNTVNSLYTIADCKKQKFMLVYRHKR